jgi:FMN phosphatase YigB (HAD superfamily)
MVLKSSVRAVVFDIGNTLWFQARNPVMQEIWSLEADQLRPLVRQWGLVLPVSLETIVEEIWQAYETAFSLETARARHREPSLPFIIKGALASHGAEISAEQAEAWWRTAWIPVRHFGVQLYPDVLDVLRELKARHSLIGVNSNRPCTADMLWPDLEDIGLAACVDAAVCSGDTGFAKPHPSTFALLSERLDVPLAEMVIVGDLCDRDCAGGKPLGMTTVLKLNGRYDVKPCQDADFVIHDLGELLHLPLFTARPVAVAESPTPHDDGNADRY